MVPYATGIVLVVVGVMLAATSASAFMSDTEREERIEAINCHVGYISGNARTAPEMWSNEGIRQQLAIPDGPLATEALALRRAGVDDARSREMNRETMDRCFALGGADVYEPMVMLARREAIARHHDLLSLSPLTEPDGRSLLESLGNPEAQ